ncbi:MAG: molybdopterin adenylyltransferase [Anaerolineae bacterium]|nr:molybdopterin adenylyltransferase [Anaerolineae bacterium]
MLRVGVLTVSDRVAQGAAEDQSGPLIAQIVRERLQALVLEERVVPDERYVIEEVLREWADEMELDLILTTGGTGFSPRDVTPEATRSVIEREAPGFAEAMRAEGLKVTPHAMLSRGVAGIRGRTLIINLPGSPKAARENLEVILPALPHGLRLLQGVEGEDQRHEVPSQTEETPSWAEDFRSWLEQRQGGQKPSP